MRSFRQIIKKILSPFCTIMSTPQTMSTAVERCFGGHATEPGFAGDIGAIEVWLIDSDCP